MRSGFLNEAITGIADEGVPRPGAQTWHLSDKDDQDFIGLPHDWWAQQERFHPIGDYFRSLTFHGSGPLEHRPSSAAETGLRIMLCSSEDLAAGQRRRGQIDGWSSLGSGPESDPDTGAEEDGGCDPTPGVGPLSPATDEE